MSGPLRPYNNIPNTNSMDPSLQQFLQWVQTTVNGLIPNVAVTPAAPSVTTVPHPGAVLIVWNEVVGSDHYAIYESNQPGVPPGVPLATVAANHGAAANSYLRSGINDTTTRYYSVMGLNGTVRGYISQGVAGVALATSATVIPVSQTPLSKNGVGGGVGGGGSLSPGQISSDTFGANQ